MKTRNLILAILCLFAFSCTPNASGEAYEHEHGTEEHGHDHDSESGDHSHSEEAPHDQEEFIIDGDSTPIHTHEDGSEHHDH